MTGTAPKPDPKDFDLNEMIRWRDHAEEFDPEEYGFEDGTYPDDFIHREVKIASTAYDSHPGSIGFLWMRTHDGRTWVRFATDDEPYPGKWGNDSVDMGPAISDEITARELIELMDQVQSPFVDYRGYVQAELASSGATTREDRAEHRAFLMQIETISDVATEWYDALADHWLDTSQLVYLDVAKGDVRQDAP